MKGISTTRQAGWALLLAFTTASNGMAATILVPGDEPTIQAGIDAASVGDTVLVAPATYSGPGNRDLDFHGVDIVVRSADGPQMTVIDCEASGRGFHLNSGETNAAVISGFSIRNGFAQWPETEGGGIFCEDASPVIDNCWITECSSLGGGGIALSQSGSRLIGCRVSDCFAEMEGGGISVNDPLSVEIIGCSISRNNAFMFRGGGILIRGGRVSIAGSFITSNESGVEFGDGGGVCCTGSALYMADCHIWDNTQTSIHEGEYSVARGGGVFAQADSVVMVRCGFERNAVRAIRDDWHNHAYGGGAAVIASYASLTECSFRGNVCESQSDVVYGREGQAHGGGLFCQSAEITSCRFEGNIASSFGGRLGNEALGGGVYGNEVSISQCVFVVNGVVASPPNPHVAAGGGVSLTGGSEVDQSTFSENWATTQGSGLSFRSGHVIVDRTIVAFGAFSEAISCGGTSVTISCSDLFGNEGGDWVGCVASQAKVNGNLSSDPLFCALMEGNLGLSADSPCAPPQSGACGLIGALSVDCGPIGVAVVEAPPADVKLTVFPNPVRGAATFELGNAAAFATLNIYDLQGRLVERLMRQDGHWQWTPGSSVPAGVYFARPEAGSLRAVAVKFLYLR